MRYVEIRRFAIAAIVAGGLLSPSFALGAERPLESQKKDKRCGEAITAIVDAKMSELGIPGVIVDVEVPGTCRFKGTFGVSAVARQQPISSSDHMRVGSITKTFTGTAVLQLVDEGSVELDEAIAHYLSGVPNGENITVRQLLQMTSGLYNYSEDVAFNQSLDDNPYRIWSIPELLEIAYSHAPYFDPGQGFHYSNTNTVLLGLLVEKVTGKPLPHVLEEKIFRPLKMNHTTLPKAADSSIPMPHPEGFMYGTNIGTLPGSCDAETVGRHDVTHASPSWTWAAGGAISSAKDLAIWAEALAKGTLLSPKTQAERLKWVATGPAPAPQYGLHVTNFSGIIGHDGALPGFQSFLGYQPEKGATILVLTNLYPDLHCGGPADAIARAIVTELRLLGQ